MTFQPTHTFPYHCCVVEDSHGYTHAQHAFSRLTQVLPFIQRLSQKQEMDASSTASSSPASCFIYPASLFLTALLKRPMTHCLNPTAHPYSSLLVQRTYYPHSSHELKTQPLNQRHLLHRASLLSRKTTSKRMRTSDLFAPLKSFTLPNMT